jgi:hypothetical protein
VTRSRSARIILGAFLVAGLAGPVMAQSPVDRVPITFAVEHLHATGSCKGELKLDKWLFSYRSADRPDDDRDWKLTELKAAESKKPNELVLRTRDSVKCLGLDKNYKSSGSPAAWTGLSSTT